VFTPAAFRFLRALKRNNRREWFEAHRAEWERVVRDPLRELVEEVDARLATTLPEIVGDPKASIFRIHRDVRFSPDKSPYKTWAAAWFFHRDAGRQVGTEGNGGAGFYFHLEPGGSLLGGGLWMPPKDQLARLRDALVEDHRPFEAIVDAPAFRRRFGRLDEEAMLVRLPRGYAPGHPAERWLRYRSFTAGRAMSESELFSHKLPDVLAKDFARLGPFVRWLNAAVGFLPAGRR
jgi:uncharacterized protein (TIGR02453 family)